MATDNISHTQNVCACVFCFSYTMTKGIDLDLQIRFFPAEIGWINNLLLFKSEIPTQYYSLSLLFVANAKPSYIYMEGKCENRTS